MRTVVLLVALVLPACGSGKYYIKDTTEGKERDPDTFRAAVLHLGAEFGYRETRELCLEDVRKNTAEAHKLIREAKQRGADIVITPEYGNTGNTITGDQRYWLGTCLPEAGCETPLYDLDLMGLHPYVKEYSKLAADLDIWIVTSVLECVKYEDRNHWYNCGLVLDNKGCVRAKYHKIYTWWLTESHLDKGKTPTVFETPFGRFGMLICSDALAPGLWNDLVDDLGSDFLIMQSHWAPTPYLGRVAMGAIAAQSDRTVLWSNHPGFLAGGAGFIHPGIANDDAISMFSGAGMVIADLPLPERIKTTASLPR
ncbi:MAG: carbon-nitrogen hydrolase family protein [Planctomycetota bacterium]